MSGGKKYEYETAEVTWAAVEQYTNIRVAEARSESESVFEDVLKKKELANSPIEEAMALGLLVMARINDIEVDFSHAEHPSGVTVYPFLQVHESAYAHVLLVQAQAPIGRYRADFLITPQQIIVADDDAGGFRFVREPYGNPIVVECDGTAFHERTEPERRKEKKRDRWMQAHDIKVLRYTGAEILESPTTVASDVLGAVFGEHLMYPSYSEWAEDYAEYLR